MIHATFEITPRVEVLGPSARIMLSSMILSSAICCCSLRPMLAWIDRPEIRLLSTFLQKLQVTLLPGSTEMRAKLLSSLSHRSLLLLLWTTNSEMSVCLSWRRGVFFCSVRSCHLLAGWLVARRTRTLRRVRQDGYIGSTVHLTIDSPAKIMANFVSQ